MMSLDDRLRCLQEVRRHAAPHPAAAAKGPDRSPPRIQGHGRPDGSRLHLVAARLRQRRFVADRSRGDLQRRREFPSTGVAQRAQDPRHDVEHPGVPPARHHACSRRGPTPFPTRRDRRPSSVKRCSTSSALTGWVTSIYYIVLLATIMILYTGGNTSFNGFPFLANYVATDKYLPRQLTKRGHRLAFSNGIIVLGRRRADADHRLQRERERPRRALRHRRLHRLHPGRRGHGGAPPPRAHRQVALRRLRERASRRRSPRSWSLSS